MEKKIKIHTPYITLGQFLKFTNIISNGGQEKVFLLENEVKVNSTLESRRGRKLKIGDKVEVLGNIFEIC